MAFWDLKLLLLCLRDNPMVAPALEVFICRLARVRIYHHSRLTIGLTIIVAAQIAKLPRCRIFPITS
jgi:hypothetical protein